jgi:hypothetical protein
MLIIMIHTIHCQYLGYEKYTYSLQQSSSSLKVWTTVPSQRVFIDSVVPTSTDSLIRVYAAQNEYEPFIVVLRPNKNTQVTVNVPLFNNELITAELFKVTNINIQTATDNLGAAGMYPDALTPIADGASISLSVNQNTAIWVNVHVKSGAKSGDYSTNFKITNGGTLVQIPVTLHVFNFEIPKDLHIQSQMYFDHNAVLTKYGVQGTGSEYWFYVDMMKQYFIDHRLTPSAPLWPGGVTSSGGAPFISYDCSTREFSDNDGIWGFEYLANRYLKGVEWNNGTGFPSWMAVGIQNNDASADQRPSTLCGATRSSSDWYTSNNPSSAYNQVWWKYMTSLQSYLQKTGNLDKALYYIANEPQGQSGYDAIAWYSAQLKKVAPNLRLMTSEEPKAEIYDNAMYPGSKIDIWWPVVTNFNHTVSWDRKFNHQEETWIYFLDSSRPPSFNPITLDKPGIESKFTGWFCWKYRLEGIGYYSMNQWSPNPYTSPSNFNENGNLFMFYPPDPSNNPIAYGSNGHRLVPSIRLELMRDSLEDYEYFYLLNEQKQPQVYSETSESDFFVNKIILDQNSYVRDDEYLYNIRRLVGLKIGNEIEAIPNLTPRNLPTRASGNPGSYSINFQDPAGSPSANPLVVKGRTFMKVGWADYSDSVGYGWFGDNSQTKYAYTDGAADNELQNSILYDDYGRKHTFIFALPNGGYNVTVSVGWKNKKYADNYISVQGNPIINVEDNSGGFIERTIQVFVTSNYLSLEMGAKGEYTMLNYMLIDANGLPIPDPPAGPAPPVPEPTVSDKNNNEVSSSSMMKYSWMLVVTCWMIITINMWD